MHSKTYSALRLVARTTRSVQYTKVIIERVHWAAMALNLKFSNLYTVWNTKTWILSILTVGPNKMKRNRVGTGTSVKSPKNVAWFSRINADKVFSRKSTSPTKMLDASAPGGIFLIKWVFPWNYENFNYWNRYVKTWKFTHLQHAPHLHLVLTLASHVHLWRAQEQLKLLLQKRQKFSSSTHRCIMPIPFTKIQWSLSIQAFIQFYKFSPIQDVPIDT